jgi:hypothetical protein
MGELMRRSKCGSDNPAGKKFCGDCGAALSARNAKFPVTRVPLECASYSDNS